MVLIWKCGVVRGSEVPPQSPPTYKTRPFGTEGKHANRQCGGGTYKDCETVGTLLSVLIAMKKDK